MTSEMERVDKHRGQVDTRSGPASYVDTGGAGRPVLFVHGVGSSSYLWRHVIELLEGQRRCVAVDLPLHGHTPAAADQDFTLPGLARFVADCCDALELTDIDLVANDTGGAVSQVFAASHAERLHTLTLTNCEAHDNMPPKALLPAVRHGGSGPPVPAPADVAARPRPAGDRTGPGPPAGPDPHRLGHQRCLLPPQVGLLAARHHPGRHRGRRDRQGAPVLPRRAGRRAHRGAAPPLGRSVSEGEFTYGHGRSADTGTGAVPRQPCAITSRSSVSRSSASPLRKNSVDWIAPIAACTASRTSPSARSGRSGASRCTHSSM